MDNQDKIFDKFKDAAQNSEQKDFPGMDKVWARVEDKLDKKEDKKAISLWKKIAVAASLLLVISIGSQFLKSDKATVIPTSKVVVNEKDSDDKSILEKSDAVVSSESPIISKSEATKILDKQIKQQQEVAMNYDSIKVYEPVGAGIATINPPAEIVAAAPIQPTYAEEDNLIAKEKVNENSGYLRKAERESTKLAFADKQSQTAKKSAPLIVINGSALSHSNDKKRDQMMQDEMPNFEPENLDSLVVLDAPLYIIDGNYYSENDLFGKNPTSPYAPLNKQEIKTITVLQDLEATSKYGERGKKGVVIITTKYGKPTPKN
ncbi:hypothetical protein DBR27_04125 [Flavobacterium sp. HMWF030]|nr:hypothetical protein DBR27_04125 [Flavobacterium sp. HMWF030]